MRRYCSIIIILFMITYTFASEQAQDWNTDDTKQVYDGSRSPSEVPQSALASIDQSRIPPESIPEIGSDWVDVNKVSDQSVLTSSQLEYGDNLGKVNDLSALDSNALKTVLNEKFGVDQPLLKSISSLNSLNGQLKNMDFIFSEKGKLIINRQNDYPIKIDVKDNSKVGYSVDGKNSKLNLTFTGTAKFGDFIEFETNDTDKSSAIEIEKLSNQSGRI